MDAGHCGVTGPFTIAFTASALSAPVAISIIARAFIIEPMPVVSALRGTSSALAKKRLFRVDRAFGQIDDMGRLRKAVGRLVERDMTVAADSKHLKIDSAGGGKAFS